MAATIPDAKLALRRHVREKLEAMAEVIRAAASTQACMLLRQQALWKQAQSILFYAPLGHELDIWPLLTEALALGKTVALPRFSAETNLYTACEIREPDRDLKLGQFGIREPVEHCALMAIYRLDLVLVPGVAFDLHGRRLGRGRGFYDLLLTLVHGTTCGVAFDEQIVSDIPVESHDISMNCILTPTRWIEP